MIRFDLKAVGFEQITVSDSAVSLTASKVTPSDSPPPTGALISVSNNPIRVRMDGSDPDASTGHLLAAGDHMLVRGLGNLGGLSMIRDGGSDGIVDVSYLR